jgi:hypothetical protein
MLKNLALCFLAAAACLAAANAHAADAVPADSFHAAKTPPEKALDDIVRRSETDEDISVYVLKIPGYDPKKAEEYSHLFTDDFLKSAAAVQARLVQKDCGGNYSEGDICGVDGNPVTCAQDVSKPDYLYQTQTEDDRTAAIVRRWSDPSPPGTESFYRLVKSGGVWKIDGIKCGDDLKFNMD